MKNFNVLLGYLPKLRRQTHCSFIHTILTFHLKQIKHTPVQLNYCIAHVFHLLYPCLYLSSITQNKIILESLFDYNYTLQTIPYVVLILHLYCNHIFIPNFLEQWTIHSFIQPLFIQFIFDVHSVACVS